APGGCVMAKTILQVEPGLFRRRSQRTGGWGDVLWYTITIDNQTRFLSTKQTDVREARKVRAMALAAAEAGVPQARARLLVEDILDGLIENYETNHLASLRTVRGHVATLKAAIGTKKARDLKTRHIVAMQRAWQAHGIVTNVTINKRCETL